MSKDELPNNPEMRDLPQQHIFSRSGAIKWGIAFIAACVTFLAYLPALQNGFVNWDDDLYVYENQNIQSISLRLFSWMPEVVIWHPLTMLSIAVDHAVWDLNPLGYHLTNILLHAFNALLVFILAVHLVDKAYEDNKKSVIVGGVTAILFGIHPLHVESVAWVSERKDVLCAFFFLLSLLAYLKYATYSAFKRYIFYALSLVFFAMSLMSKPMAVSLPIVLLIFDLYPLRRLMMKGMGIKWVLIEKFPFFLLSLIFSLLAIGVHQSSGVFQASDIPPFTARILEAAWAYIFYLGKMIFPANLAPFYPHQEKISLFSFEYLGSLVLLLMITIVAIIYLKKGRLLLPIIWFYYLVTLIPVIGIVQVGSYAAADRFLYLPSLSFLFLIGLLVSSFFGEGLKKQYRLTIVLALIFIFGILTVKTIRQISIWRDSITLWSHEIKLFPDAIDKAYFNLGAAYNGTGNYPLAIRSYDTGIKLNSRDAQAYFNRGFAHDNLGNYQQALKDYSKAIELNPLFADAFNNRGIVYNNLGNKQLAIIDLIRAVEINPQYAMAYYNLGLVSSQLGNDTLAQINYGKAADLNPGLFK